MLHELVLATSVIAILVDPTFPEAVAELREVEEAAADVGLIARGDDEQMGARPMARVIQEHIKKPLAEEVLFGRLKSGGQVRVIVIIEESGETKLGFDYPDGPVTPRADKLPEPRRAKERRSTPRRKPFGPRGGTVPNVPLVKV